ncbi:helix-turn-helix domain-containing protein [Streptomyces sp. NPDC090022]|uniref:helix-turn-helix domain-containing protein n=1 Tax=Streptomyces sp. NPDC090022 TaxID=3365920 RepID=UPI00380B9B23
MPYGGGGGADPAVAGRLLRLLDLLAQGGGTEEFARPAAEARAAGAPAEELALLARATDVALGVHRALGQHRRREAELEALFDTAGDLAALRDLDSVLRAIVRRARKLLHTDVAYLTLHDPVAGDTYMRVTEGSVSAAFQQLRLAMGDGLGGLVAQTARPYASTDYRTDTRFRHVAAIDKGVDEEGLCAILGVPLSLGTRVIGVLFAADRSPRDFAPDAIALLASLADHAAIAIDSARRLEETRAALAELDAANRTARAHSSAIARAAETHDRLTDLVLRGGGVAEVAREIASVLGGRLVVHDADGTELARVGPHGGVRPGAGEDVTAHAPSADAVAASRGGGRAVCVEGGVWVCAVLAGPELLGAMALTGRADLGDADRRLFERAGLVTALLLLMRRSVAEAEDRVRGELLDDLLTPPVGPPSVGTPDGGGDGAGGDGAGGGLGLRARRLGVDLGRPTCVLVLRCDPTARARLVTEAARQARALGGLAGPHRGHVVLLAPCADPGPLAVALAEDLGRAVGARVTAGSAGPAAGPGQIPAVYAEAVRCAEALHTLGRAGEGAALPDLGFVGVLLGDRTDIHGYVTRVLGPVIDYDTARGTELLRTLDAYYAQGGSLSLAKDALHVHVNTVAQRLERVALLLGRDWNAPGRALENQLALRLHRLLTP